jgi:hypothetical protein
MRGPVATSQSTGTARAGMPPSGSSGHGARRVQSTTPVGVGSPEATPRVKGSSVAAGEPRGTGGYARVRALRARAISRSASRLATVWRLS